MGQKVKLHGLVAAPQYNEQVAEVLSLNEAQNRYHIKLSDGAVRAIKAENLKPLKEQETPRLSFIRIRSAITAVPRCCIDARVVRLGVLRKDSC